MKLSSIFMIVATAVVVTTVAIFSIKSTSRNDGTQVADSRDQEDSGLRELSCSNGTQCLLRVFLGGAYDSGTGMMTASLNAVGGNNNLIPLSQPYDGISVDANTQISQLNWDNMNSGVWASNKVVDWVVVELRDSFNPEQVLVSKAGLLRQDGYVYSYDGSTPILNSLNYAGNDLYYIAIKHRNHLGIMTQNPVQFPANIDMTTTQLYDMTDSTSPAKNINGINVMWPGDANANGIISYSGSNNDRDSILTVVGNGTPNNVINNVYSREDINMDRKVKYTGSSNDRDLILQNVGSTNPNNTLVQQLPGTIPLPVSIHCPGTPVVFYRSVDKVKLNWPACTGTGEINYSITRTVNGQNPVVIQNEGSTEYVDTNIVNGTPYTYTVTAVNLLDGETLSMTPVVAGILSTEFSLNQQFQTTEEISSNDLSKLQTGGDLPGQQLSQVVQTGTQGNIAGATPVYYRDTGTNPYAKTFWQVDSEDIDIPGNPQLWIAEDVLDPVEVASFPPVVTQTLTSCMPGTQPTSISADGTGTGPSNDGHGAGGSVLMSSSYSTISINNPSITICWVGVSGRPNGTLFRRETESDPLNGSSWTQIVTGLNLAVSGSFTDSTVENNKLYEYKMNAGGTHDISGSVTNTQIVGYLATGIEVPLSEYNGEIVLVFANDIANGIDGQAPTSFGTGLQNPINQLVADLEGDRWTVDYVYVTKNLTGSDTPVTTRNKILARSGTNTKAVYLIGNVPIPFMQGDPDGHGTRLYPSDIIYADKNETVSYNGINNCSTITNWGSSTMNQGVGVSFNTIYNSGQSVINNNQYRICYPGQTNPQIAEQPISIHNFTPEFQVGRIDMFDLGSLGTEESLMNGYLSKIHNMKTSATDDYNLDSISQKAFYVDGFADNPDWFSPVHRDGWNDVTSVAGPYNNNAYAIGSITNNNINISANHPMSVKTLFVNDTGGAVSCKKKSDVGVGGGGLADLTQSGNEWKGVFNVIGVSYMGNWACTDNVLRSILADGYGANSIYSLTNYTYLHTMGMGKNIGYAYMATSAGNASSGVASGGVNLLYTPANWDINVHYYEGNPWSSEWDHSAPYDTNATTSLLGDPTMRMSYVKMPQGATMTNSSGHPMISWSASLDTVDGYLVYKIDSTGHHRVRFVVNSLTWTDQSTTFTSGLKYMVTAIKKKNSPGGGTYWNESLGKIVSN